jgi:hypothetical protein
MPPPLTSHFAYFSGGVFPPGTEQGWTFGPHNFGTSTVVLTAHPEPAIDTTTGFARRLAVTEIQSERAADESHFVHVTVRNVGSTVAEFYSLWLTIITLQP